MILFLYGAMLCERALEVLPKGVYLNSLVMFYFMSIFQPRKIIEVVIYNLCTSMCIYFVALILIKLYHLDTNT